MVQTHLWALSRIDPYRPPADELRRAIFISPTMAPLLVEHLGYPERTAQDVLAALVEGGVLQRVEGGLVVTDIQNRYLPTLRKRYDTRERVRRFRDARAAGWVKKEGFWMHPATGRRVANWREMFALMEPNP
jgi:hypothetical protein